MFLSPNFLGEGPKFLDLHYIEHPDSDNMFRILKNVKTCFLNIARDWFDKFQAFKGRGAEPNNSFFSSTEVNSLRAFVSDSFGRWRHKLLSAVSLAEWLVVCMV